MFKKRFIVRDKVHDYSLASYSLRVKSDSQLHDRVTDFITKHDTSYENLVDKLLNNHFSDNGKANL